jgi:acetylornithine/N-succinyldiaminopimelate aminotransferase
MGSLAQINQEFSLFTEIRGKGLMIGAELNDAWKGRAGDLAEVARQYGVLMLIAGPNVARFLPPLTLNDEDLQEGMERLHKAFESIS